MPWTWAAASVVGTSHQRFETPCQDSHRVLVIGGVLVAIVSDGAGSATHGKAGSTLVCRTLSSELSALLRRGSDLSDEALHATVDRVRDRIAHVAAGRELRSRDFAATLVAMLATDDDTIIMHVGDGAAVVRSDRGWSAASWPEAGEHASTTFFVTDDGGVRLRISRLGAPVSQAALMSDGLERLALDFTACVPHVPFFEGIFRPLVAADCERRSERIGAGLRTFLSSAAVNSRTDDDKTLVLARRT
jgi:hypothetical protein